MNLHQDSEVRPQTLNSGPQNSLFFGLRIMGLGIRRMVGYFVDRAIGAEIIAAIDGNLMCGSFLSEEHERGVDGDTREPSPEIGPAFEVAQVNKCSQQRVLNGVFGILTRSRDAMSSAKKLLSVLAGKRGEGR